MLTCRLRHCARLWTTGKRPLNGDELKQTKDAAASLDKKIDAVQNGTRTAPGFGLVNRDLTRLIYSVESADVRPADAVRSAAQQSCDALDKDLVDLAATERARPGIVQYHADGWQNCRRCRRLLRLPARVARDSHGRQMCRSFAGSNLGLPAHYNRFMRPYFRWQLTVPDAGVGPANSHYGSAQHHSGFLLRRRRVSSAGTSAATRAADAGRRCRYSGPRRRVHPSGSPSCWR